MGKIPHLYQKVLDGMQRYEQEQAVRREIRRRQIISELCSSFRLNRQDAEEALRELQAMNQVSRINQRKVQLKRR